MLNNSEKYLYSKFTAHIRKEPSELEYVLNSIKIMKDEETIHSHELHPPHLNPASKKIKIVLNYSSVKRLKWSWIIPHLSVDNKKF